MKDAANSFCREEGRANGFSERCSSGSRDVGGRREFRQARRLARVEARPREEAILVAEGAMVRAASRDDNRVRHQVPVSLNKVPPYGRQRFQGTHRRLVAALWRSCRQVLQELREGVLSGSDKDRVCVRCRLIRQRCDVEATEQYVGTTRTIVVSDLVPR